MIRKRLGYGYSGSQKLESTDILVEWLLIKEKCVNKRYFDDGKIILRAMKPAIGDYYYPYVVPGL